MCSVIPFLFSALLLIRLSFPVRCVLCTVSQCWHLPWRWGSGASQKLLSLILLLTHSPVPSFLFTCFFFLLNISHNRNLFFFLFFLPLFHSVCLSFSYSPFSLSLSIPSSVPSSWCTHTQPKGGTLHPLAKNPIAIQLLFSTHLLNEYERKKIESHSPYAGTKILMNYSPYSAIMIGNCVVLSFIIPPLPLEPFLMQSCSLCLFVFAVSY